MAEVAKQPESHEKVLHLGIFPRRSAQQTDKMFRPIADYLSQQLGMEVKLEQAKNFDEFWAAVHNKHYQLVHYNPYHYIRSHKELGYRVILKNEEQGKDSLSGALVVRKAVISIQFPT
jgi:phosphonate transport system substrate-binding protein